MGEPKPPFYDDLPGTLRHAWALLAQGLADRRSPLHTPTVATVGLDGSPRARIVVLRAVDAEQGQLRFHTDRRSQKWAELAREPRLALLAYDPAAKFQIRLEGVAMLHADDAVADAAWSGSRSFSRVCYGTIPAPGAELTAGDAFALPASEDEIAAGRTNFGAVVLHAERLETLYLDHDGHRRARFDLRDGGATWLAP